MSPCSDLRNWHHRKLKMKSHFNRSLVIKSHALLLRCGKMKSSFREKTDWSVNDGRFFLHVAAADWWIKGVSRKLRLWRICVLQQPDQYISKHQGTSCLSNGANAILRENWKDCSVPGRMRAQHGCGDSVVMKANPCLPLWLLWWRFHQAQL